MFFAILLPWQPAALAALINISFLASTVRSPCWTSPTYSINTSIGSPALRIALNELNPAQIDFAVISNAIFISIDWQEKPDTLVIAQGIRRNIVTFTYFR